MIFQNVEFSSNKVVFKCLHCPHPANKLQKTYLNRFNNQNNTNIPNNNNASSNNIQVNEVPNNDNDNNNRLNEVPNTGEIKEQNRSRFLKFYRSYIIKINTKFV